MGKQKPKTSIIARISSKAVDSLYARICLRTRRSKSVSSGFVPHYTKSYFTSSMTRNEHNEHNEPDK